MAMPDHYRRLFGVLRRAGENGDLAIMECTEISTGLTRYVICAVGRDGADFVMTPFGHLQDGNPYAAYRPLEVQPSPDEAMAVP